MFVFLWLLWVAHLVIMMLAPLVRCARLMGGWDNKDLLMAAKEAIINDKKKNRHHINANFGAQSIFFVRVLALPPLRTTALPLDCELINPPMLTMHRDAHQTRIGCMRAIARLLAFDWSPFFVLSDLPPLGPALEFSK